MNDIQKAFLDDYQSSHGRSEVANYTPYFLGSIITSSDADGAKPLIDGQQRITSTFLLLAYLERYRRENSLQATMDLMTLLGSVSYGSTAYTIDFPASRKNLFERYLDFDKSSGEAILEAEDVADLDSGDLKILDALRATDSVLDSKVKAVMAHFIDYVTQRVLLIDISVSSEAEAHRVFVTMNDRGLRLSPIDLLKGNILSKIPNPTDAKECHDAWVKTMNGLREIDPEEDSLFFRNFLRAKWASTIRGKSKGDLAGDYDQIGDGYHRWFESNLSKMEIVTSDDYVTFARVIVPKFAEVYEFIKAAEKTLTVGVESIYFNAVRKYTFQPMVLLAAVDVSDTKQKWKAKLARMSDLVDLILTTRTIEGKENNYDTLKEPSFTLTKDSRGKDGSEILEYVRNEWTKYTPIFAQLGQMRYSKADRTDLLYLLARIANYFEAAFALSNKVGFAAYFQRDRGVKTYDIEHLLKEAFDTTTLPSSHGFADAKDYADARNFIGALTLLPRGRNRSLQAKPYTEKLPVYATENVLAQTLTPGFYQNNPNVSAFLQSKPSLTLSSIDNFGRGDITSRAALYESAANEIWKSP